MVQLPPAELQTRPSLIPQSDRVAKGKTLCDLSWPANSLGLFDSAKCCNLKPLNQLRLRTLAAPKLHLMLSKSFHLINHVRNSASISPKLAKTGWRGGLLQKNLRTNTLLKITNTTKSVHQWCVCNLRRLLSEPWVETLRRKRVVSNFIANPFQR